MGIELITDVTVEPISLELAWAHLRIDAEGSPPESAHDYWLEAIGIPGAREAAERFTGRAFAVKRYKLTLDEFPDGAIVLKNPPLVDVVSVEYVNADEQLQTLDETAYTTDKSLLEPWVIPADSWPATASIANAVRVTYDAGYAPESVPKDALWAMLLLLGHAFKNREALTEKQQFDMPIGIESLLRRHRLLLGMA